MQERTDLPPAVPPQWQRLFKDSEGYSDGDPLAAGFYQLELPHGFRWIGSEARCLLPVEHPASCAQPALELTLHTNPFGWTPHLSVFINGEFIGARAIPAYGSYLFPIDPQRTPLTDPLEITLRTNHAQAESEQPGARRLSLPVYGLRLHDLDRDGAFEERRLFIEQMSLFSNTSLPGMLTEVAKIPNGRILELGAGPGWLTFLMAARSGAAAVGVDLYRYLETPETGFKLKLIEQMTRHLCVLRRDPGFSRIHSADGIRQIVSQSCDFYTMDATDLPLRDESFDLVVSLNAFEHIGRPGLALREIRRLLKPGGEALICFSPLYFSDSGYHLAACGLLNLPWAHLLHGRDDIKRLVREAGHPDNEVDGILDSLNGWTPRQFDEAFDHCGLKIVKRSAPKGFAIPGSESSPEFKQLKQQYPIDDLTTISMQFRLRKTGG